MYNLSSRKYFKIVSNSSEIFALEFARWNEFCTLNCGVRNSRSARSSFLAMIITFSFQLQIVHRLKHWTPDFPRFEMTYGMHNLSFIKSFKNVSKSSKMQHFCSNFDHPKTYITSKQIRIKALKSKLKHLKSKLKQVIKQKDMD